MTRIGITGIGFVSSLGNSIAEVSGNLSEGNTGIENYPPFEGDHIPVNLLGTIREFSFTSTDYEDWTYPDRYRFKREQLRSMTPSAVMGACSAMQAIEDSKLQESDLHDDGTAIFCGSGGSTFLTYENLKLFEKRGARALGPMTMVNSIPGSLNINLAALFGIRGGALGITSACSSSAHALGLAVDWIRLGRLKRVLVTGAEDCDIWTIVPFTSCRALSTQESPHLAPRAFDKNRDGFVGTGGAVTLVVEELESARQRGVEPYCQVSGWGQSSDGYNVMVPEPDGEGLARSMFAALSDARVQPEAIDYLNAHATGTPAGDLAEIRAIKKVFPEEHRPDVGSTKSLTGHALSMAGALESALCCLAIRDGYMPVSANISDLDPDCDGVPILTERKSEPPRHVLSNSSGFGGSNVSVVLSALADSRRA